MSENRFEDTDVHQLRSRITEMEESQLALSRIISHLPAGFALHELVCDESGEPKDYRFLEINPEFEAMLGLSKEDVIGKTVLEILPETESYWIQTWGQVALTGRPAYREDFSESFGKYYSAHAFSPEKGKFAVVFTDITEKKKLEAERSEMLEKLGDMLAKIKMLSGLLPICAHCKKIKGNEGSWLQIEEYMDAYSEAKLSHGICPECVDDLYNDM